MKFIYRVGVILVVLLLSTTVASAATVNLAWDNPIDPDFAGIRVYRASGQCISPGPFVTVKTYGKVDIGSDVVTSDGDYCYVATAIDTAGNESIQSNKLGVTVNVNPPAAPLNLRSTGVTP